MSHRRPPLLALVLSVVFVAGLLPGHAAAAETTWRYNTYRSGGYLTQDPYSTACTAASAMMMLNFIALAGTGGPGFIWRASRVKNSPTDYADMMSILWFSRAHDTLASTRPGSDAHGWRNALNNYGWGQAAMLDPSLRIYEDLTFIGFDSAVRAAVAGIARFHKPVGMLGWGGGHAQVITGYVVTGEDPSVSLNFTVTAVYLSDPLYKDGIVNRLIGVTQLKSGSLTYRLRPYAEVDSPKDDGYSGGWRRSSVASLTSEWYRRYVLIIPIRNGLPATDPPPDPTPSPSASPDPGVSPDPTPSPSASPDPGVSPDPSPSTSG